MKTDATDVEVTRIKTTSLGHPRRNNIRMTADVQPPCRYESPQATNTWKLQAKGDGKAPVEERMGYVGKVRTEDSLENLPPDFRNVSCEHMGQRC